MYLIVLSTPPPAGKKKEDKRRAEMFMSRQQSRGRVLWPDVAKLASPGVGGWGNGEGAAGCVRQDVRAPSFRRRLKKRKERPAVGAHCVNSQRDHRWWKFEWHKQMLGRGRRLLPPDSLTCALGDWRPRRASIILSAGKVYEDKSREERSECKFEAKKK